MNERHRRVHSSIGDADSASTIGVSHKALTVARLIDRHCRAPGIYTVTLLVPTHSRNPWKVEVSRLERIRSLEIDRKGDLSGRQ